ncbi:tyrosine-type recombinase/integrase [Alkalibacillus almallahensis]|uniref:tyrosine-type recombinase/integrase n=1 Tax=Alkalibacillus almallahensis TaxID=1379154 RepID=UPI001423E0B8|nr:tyrosine-type recombinase/integrase [Alkalibacillus almallahensis]NIK13146.1 integrase/recombinase XerD [Alkalibacillus almallahensis]
MANRWRKNELIGAELDLLDDTVGEVPIHFDAGLDLFIKEGERKGLRDVTLHFYRRETSYLRRYLIAQGHSLILNEVTRAHIDGFVDFMRETRGLKNGAINTRIRGNRTFFNFLAETKRIKDSPMYKYPLLKEQKGNIETFTINQLRKLLNAPNRRTFTGQRDYTIMLLWAETGLRLSETQGIKVEDVKLSEGQIFVRHTKTHEHRYVPIQHRMKEQLQRYLRLRGTSPETDKLFVTLDGTELKQSPMQKLPGKYGAQIGIKNVRLSPHTFRHTFAKLSVMNGAGVFELQKILGHSTMDMVRTYVNLYSSDLSEKHREFSPLKDL